MKTSSLLATLVAAYISLSILSTAKINKIGESPYKNSFQTMTIKPPTII